MFSPCLSFIASLSLTITFTSAIPRKSRQIFHFFSPFLESFRSLFRWLDCHGQRSDRYSFPSSTFFSRAAPTNLFHPFPYSTYSFPGMTTLLICKTSTFAPGIPWTPGANSNFAKSLGGQFPLCVFPHGSVFSNLGASTPCHDGTYGLTIGVQT